MAQITKGFISGTPHDVMVEKNAVKILKSGQRNTDEASIWLI